MIIEVGAPVVLVEGVDELWHLPPTLTGRPLKAFALCGLQGVVYAYDGPVRRRRLCSVCRTRRPDAFLTLDGDYVARSRRPHGGGRPKGSVTKFTEPQARLLHRIYCEEQVSARAIAEKLRGQGVTFATEEGFGAAITGPDSGLILLPRDWGRMTLADGRDVLCAFVDSKPLETGRNDRCPCGSGIKFKRCCGK